MPRCAHPSASQYVGSPRAGERRREQERAHSGRQAQRQLSQPLARGGADHRALWGETGGNGQGGTPTEYCEEIIDLLLGMLESQKDTPILTLLTIGEAQ